MEALAPSPSTCHLPERQELNPRSTGGAHQIVFTFSAPVTVASATVTSGIGAVGLLSGNGTNTITVDLTGVANAQYITVRLNCVTDGLNVGNVSVTMGVLAGDANAGGSVTGTDVSIVKSQPSAWSRSTLRSCVSTVAAVTGSFAGQHGSRRDHHRGRADLPVDKTGERSYVVTLPGSHKLKTLVNLIVGEHALRAEALAIRQPDENREKVGAVAAPQLPAARGRLHHRRRGRRLPDWPPSTARSQCVHFGQPRRDAGGGRRVLRRVAGIGFQQRHPARVGVAAQPRRVHRKPEGLPPPSGVGPNAFT